VVQLVGVILLYMRLYWSMFPDWLGPWSDLGPLQLLRFALYFPLGVVCGMHPRSCKSNVSRIKRALPLLTLLVFAMSVVEASWAYARGGDLWPGGGDQTKLSSALFSVALILCFVAYDRMKMPLARVLSRLGTHSYGLYLAHYPILGIVAKVVQRTLPWVVELEGLHLALLFSGTLGLAMLLMESVSRLPTKRVYRYLFG
jgi:peptidoglycan/LPS O-acetylase OafA/YrhL